MRPLAAFVLALFSVLLIGCGGSGAPNLTGRAPTDATRNTVQTSFGKSLLTLALGGPQSGRQGLAANAAGSGAAAWSMVGAFVKGAAEMHATRSREEGVSEPGGTGETGGTGGGVPPEDGGWQGDPGFYFDEWLGLWVQPEFLPNEVSFQLFEDQERTRPAGHITSNWPDDPATFPQVYESSYTFLAGLMAGAHGTYNTTITSSDAGTMSYDNTYADGSTDSGSSSWTSQDSQWQGRYDGADGSWYQYSGSFNANGSGTSQSSDSFGNATSFQYNTDGSGSGRIEGNDPGLPATITWDSIGNIRIVWADGTVDEYNWGWCVTGAAEATGAAPSVSPGGP